MENTYLIWYFGYIQTWSKLTRTWEGGMSWIGALASLVCGRDNKDDDLWQHQWVVLCCWYVLPTCLWVTELRLLGMCGRRQAWFRREISWLFLEWKLEVKKRNWPLTVFVVTVCAQPWHQMRWNSLTALPPSLGIWWCSRGGDMYLSGSLVATLVGRLMCKWRRCVWHLGLREGW